jgi:hypothetical protein
MINRCGTIGCMRNATHKLVYTFPKSRDGIEIDLVCESCGAGYMRRPSLRASLTALSKGEGK